MDGRSINYSDWFSIATSAPCPTTNGRPSVNFSLPSTTDPSSATATGSRDLPQLQRPRRRRVSPGKVVALILVTMLAVAGVVASRVPVMSKTIQGFFTTSNAGVITYSVHAGALPITVV